MQRINNQKNPRDPQIKCKEVDQLKNLHVIQQCTINRGAESHKKPTHTIKWD